MHYWMFVPREAINQSVSTWPPCACLCVWRKQRAGGGLTPQSPATSATCIKMYVLSIKWCVHASMGRGGRERNDQDVRRIHGNKFLLTCKRPNDFLHRCTFLKLHVGGVHSCVYSLFMALLFRLICASSNYRTSCSFSTNYILANTFSFWSV